MRVQSGALVGAAPGFAGENAVQTRKSGPCWRDSTEDKGFAGRAAPTWTAVQKNKAPLIWTVFGKEEEIDDETRQTKLSSSISPRPPGRLEWNAGGNSGRRSRLTGKRSGEKGLCSCGENKLEKRHGEIIGLTTDRRKSSVCRQFFWHRMQIRAGGTRK